MFLMVLSFHWRHLRYIYSLCVYFIAKLCFFLFLFRIELFNKRLLFPGFPSSRKKNKSFGQTKVAINNYKQLLSYVVGLSGYLQQWVTNITLFLFNLTWRQVPSLTISFIFLLFRIKGLLCLKCDAIVTK